MARLPRYYAADQPQHTIVRGNNRSPIFTSDDDQAFFLSCLSNAAHQHGCAIHAYVLMTNHVHVLTTPKHADSLPKMWQVVGRRYVRFFNHNYHRTGTLWEGRYKATVIDTDHYLLNCYRYIELNPVRAGMMADPGAYRWSSYGHHAHGQKDTVITEHPLYLALGDTAPACQTVYREMFRIPLADAFVDAIREATNKAWALGNDHFKDDIQVIAQRRSRALPMGGTRSWSLKGVRVD